MKMSFDVDKMKQQKIHYHYVIVNKCIKYISDVKMYFYFKLLARTLYYFLLCHKESFSICQPIIEAIMYPSSSLLQEGGIVNIPLMFKLVSSPHYTTTQYINAPFLMMQFFFSCEKHEDVWSGYMPDAHIYKPNRANLFGSLTTQQP